MCYISLQNFHMISYTLETFESIVKPLRWQYGHYLDKDMVRQNNVKTYAESKPEPRTDCQHGSLSHRRILVKAAENGLMFTQCV